MSEDTLPPSLQESLLALLAFNDKQGTVVAAQVKPEHFDAPYQEIATKLLAYRREQGRAPGHAHLDDLFGWALERGDRAPRLRKLLAGITELGRGLNAGYIVGQTQNHIRRQSIKSAVMRASELYGANTETVQIEQVLYNALKAQTQGISTGTRLNDSNFTFLDRKPVDIPLGIKELDRIDFGLAYKQMLLYIAPKGSGKSWLCVHVGKQGLLHRAKVLHISCEMDEATVEGRYYQALFGVARRPVAYLRTKFEYDQLRRLVGWESQSVKPRMAFTDPNIRKFLREKRKPHGLRLGSIIIKEFPSGSLTLSNLQFYLDYLESMEKFVPTLVIIDYPDLMKHDMDNLRISIGQTVVGLRGLAQQRNFALFAPTQGGRGSLGAKRVRSNMVTEDISKVFTADNTLTYSQTEAEKRLNLARLYVDHARSTEGGYEIVISQAYSIGQYVLESALKSSMYDEQLRGEDGNSET